MTTFTFNNVTFKTNDKNYFGKVIDGKTLPITREEYTEAKAQFDAQTPEEPEAPAPKQAPAKPDQKAKAPAKPVTPTRATKEYVITEDSRGRIAYMQGKAKLIGVQPAKTHFTVYISKHLLSTPEEVTAALGNRFKVNAVVNPTFKKNGGKDSFSVKATVTDATRNDLNELCDLLITKNNEVVGA